MVCCQKKISEQERERENEWVREWVKWTWERMKVTYMNFSQFLIKKVRLQLTSNLLTLLNATLPQLWKVKMETRKWVHVRACMHACVCACVCARMQLLLSADLSLIKVCYDIFVKSHFPFAGRLTRVWTFTAQPCWAPLLVCARRERRGRERENILIISYFTKSHKEPFLQFLLFPSFLSLSFASSAHNQLTCSSSAWRRRVKAASTKLPFCLWRSARR